MKINITRDYVGFVDGDDLIVDKGAVLDVSAEAAAFLLENGIAEEDKPKPKPKPAPRKK